MPQAARSVRLSVRSDIAAVETMSFGAIIHRYRWAILTAWLAAAVALVLTVHPPDPRTVRQESFLPAEAPSRRAAELLMRYFPAHSGLSEAVVVLERPNGALSAADMETVNLLVERIARPSQEASAEDLVGVTVRSPASIALPTNPLTGEPLARNPLISPEGQAVLVIVNIPANFITLRSDRVVRHLRGILAGMPLPEGLRIAVSGSAGFGHDYAAAARSSHRSALRVTLLAVIVILLVVYRSPVAAAIPLVSISVAAVVVAKLLALAGRLGMHTGTAESIFAFVLLYGAGVDYSVLLIGRCREGLHRQSPPDQALANGLDRSLRTIVASAGTNIAGLMTLSMATYGVFRTTGPAVALAIGVATIASVTLTPALAAVAGAKLFWPRGATPLPAVTDAPQDRPRARRGLWPMVAMVVTRHSRIVLSAAVLILAIPALRGARVQWVYDALAAVKPASPEGVGNASAGIEIANRHWPSGEVAPISVLLQADRSIDQAQWRRIQQSVLTGLGRLGEVRNVRALVAPFGEGTSPAVNALLAAAAGGKVAAEYVSADGKASRLTVVLDLPPLTLEAMDALAGMRDTIATSARSARSGLEVHLAGATAEMADIRTVTRRDFHLIAPLASGVVFLIVLVLLRDWVLSAFMVAGTLLGYLATLGICQWVFAGLLGSAGLDWKVQVFLFVVLMAVGQDYNIFLAARLAEEAAALPVARATRRALIHTGPVISSCGIIMAATLGSLLSGDLALLRQLGFALALGVLIDTFLVRPLLLPALITLTGRTGRMGSLIR
jgi:RND superfamily putative drug exporter